MQKAAARLLPDGRRLHLQHGPIDLVIEVWGAGQKAAYDRASERFQTVLDDLVSELAVLRVQSGCKLAVSGRVAQRMVRAVEPFAKNIFITPMAAVAGAVAEEILAELATVDGVQKACVNNGGDVAVMLRDGEVFDAAIAGTPPAMLRLTRDDGVGGIATSGWGGRSHSLGIADSVTVLADCAATADAAATMIANAVDVPEDLHDYLIPTIGDCTSGISPIVGIK